MQGPLESLEQWDDFVKERYDPNRTRDEFRKYTDETPPVVREFYRQNHTFQTRDFVREKKRQYLSLDRRRMGIWEALEYLNTLVDDSDPDTALSQIEHCLQTAEAIRGDGHPRWFGLCVVRQDRLPGVLRRESRFPSARVPDPRRYLQGGRRSR
jgi:inositol oxygenase